MIWVVGSEGMLGSRLCSLLDKAGMAFVKTDLETSILDPQALAGFAGKQAALDCLINCSGYTNVDKAESDCGAAYAVNETGVRNLAELAAGLAIPLIHISTDYVFDGRGTRPYREDDPVGPVSVYGASKLAGEKAALEACSKTIIIRTSWLYDSAGKNFFLTMLRLFREKGEASVVADQKGNPTWAADLARAILSIVQRLQNALQANLFGVFHFSNEGITSWYEFAREIATQAFAAGLLEKKPLLTPVASDAWPTPVKRPAWSALDKTKIKKTFGVSVPAWQQSLAACLEEYRKQL